MAESDATAKAPRPLRADAKRNRDAILRAAREAFDNEGVLASLDGIAVLAGVGNATLYRNFPTRDDLLSAVIETNIDAAVLEAKEMSRNMAPRRALVEWLIYLAWQLRIWHDLPYCIAIAHSDANSPVADACNPLVAATAALLDAAKSSGDVAESITATEVFELVTTLSWGVDRFQDDIAAARRRVTMATAGIFT